MTQCDLQTLIISNELKDQRFHSVLRIQSWYFIFSFMVKAAMRKQQLNEMLIEAAKK